MTVAVLSAKRTRAAANAGREETRRRSRRALALAAAFALVVALEATLFGVYAPAKEGQHERGAHVQQGQGDNAGDSSGQAGGLVAIAAVLITFGGIAFPFFLQTPRPAHLPARSGSGRTSLAETGQFVCLTVALFSTSAALVHFAVLWEHFRESWLFGAFFAVAASLQLAWAALIVRRPSRALLRAGAVGNLGVAAVWLLSRTAGLPLGPAPWSPEPVSVADSLATIFEVGIVVGAIVLLRSWSAGLAVRPRIVALATWALSLVLIPLTSVALVSAAGGGL
jgi:hypothetical protein